jgi:mannosyl-oligosaccharide alpha-1,2-mannosidase
MNVRDPFNLRNGSTLNGSLNGSLNRPPIATWKSNRRYNSPSPSPLHHILLTAAADLRDKASEAVHSAQHALAEAAATTLHLDDEDDLERASAQPEAEEPKNNSESQKEETAAALEKKKDMSFAVPKNVPSFSNPQRELEDHLWAASSSSNSSRQRSSGGLGSANSIVGGVQDLLSSSRSRGAALPMYKDKPYMYPPGRGGPAWQRPAVYRRKRTCGLLLLVVVAVVWWTGLFAGPQQRAVGKLNQWGWLTQEDGGGKKVDWLERRERVVEAMELSWDAYERYAWGGFFFSYRDRAVC